MATVLLISYLHVNTIAVPGSKKELFQLLIICLTGSAGSVKNLFLVFPIMVDLRTYLTLWMLEAEEEEENR